MRGMHSVSDPARLDDEIFRMELTRAEADNLARMIWGAVGLVMHREAETDA